MARKKRRAPALALVLRSIGAAATGPQKRMHGLRESTS